MMTTGVHLCVCSIGAQGRSFDTDTRFTLNSCVFYTHGRLLFLFVSTSSSPLTDGLLLESCMSVTLTREAMTIGSLVLISYRSMYDAMPSSRENSARARRELFLSTCPLQEKQSRSHFYSQLDASMYDLICISRVNGKKIKHRQNRFDTSRCLKRWTSVGQPVSSSQDVLKFLGND